MSGSKLLIIDRQREYIFYTMRGGVMMGMMDARVRQQISHERTGK
jgi:hypothetical protein